MIDSDASTADALRLLSQPVRADGRRVAGWTRRGFLQAVGGGLAGGGLIGGLAPSIPGEVREAFAGPPIGPNDGIVVTIMLYGGNDGLNTVVPYADGRYYDQRANIAVPAAQVLPIDGQVGLHPNLPHLRSLYDSGNVAIVQGVGYPSPDLSHFTSMATWMSARFGGGAPSSGWIGRWLDGQTAAVAEMGAASIDSSVPLHLLGATRRAVGIPPWGDMFGADSEPQDLRMYAGIAGIADASGGRGDWHDLFAATMRRQLAVARDVMPVFSGALPEGELIGKLTVAARLINANLGLRFIDVGLGGFDTHDSQADTHPDLLAQLDAALQAFHTTLLPVFRDRVTIVTLSEFGRTSFSNDSGGTDHGTASDMFVIGSRVRGGLYGQRPSLAGLQRWDRLEHHVDFRAVIGTVLDQWMGGGGSSILNGGFENLGLFVTGPGTSSGWTGAPIVLAPAPPSGFVPLSPRRIFDTRDGTGGRDAPVGQGEIWSVPLAGLHGIADDAVAVALNLTSVDASEPSFVTVFPNGEARPFASNLNPVPAMAVPNLVLARVGLDRAVNFFNNTGSVHLVADVVGFFTPAGGDGLLPMTPVRLLDSRDGTGGVIGPLGQGETVTVQVAGTNGVAVDATAVALNVTATGPTEGSYLTVWPSGQPRPLASSVNMVAGQTVPNMVLCRLGADGRVHVYNNSGSTHVVVDVLGCFTAGADAKYLTMSPARALDTREGHGAALGRLGRGSLSLALAGQHGVPADGVTAVVLNVTAVAPSDGTFVTVYPGGTERPLASNLNAVTGQIVPNMVLARLGGGAVAIYNNSGDIDLVADVMGYFTS